MSRRTIKSAVQRGGSKQIDINKFVNSWDFERYLKFLEFDHKVIYKESEITSIDEMFQGNNYLAIIILNDLLPVGHWVCLRKDNIGEYTYFDCLADPLPDTLKTLFNELEAPVKVKVANKALMDRKGIICGKYCLAFALCGDTDIDTFINILSTNKKRKPDEIVDKMYRLEYGKTKFTFN